ncbi:MAG: gamma carbonic anhydrase family protein [Anaerolineae bacterium]|nr:gamma carbonic anhydrase family protein [Anaerolineae bacterium]
MSKYPFRPQQVHPTAWIAPGAVVVGDVHLAEESSVWFNAVIRGDTDTLTIGARSNIQDLTMIHADPGFPVEIAEDVTVGHKCIIHGAKVGRMSLVGMGAILLNGVEVGEECLIGAGALLTQGKVFPPRSLILGSPAKVVREVTDADLLMIAHGAEHYVQKAKEYRGTGA